jgi:hypothetical protein
MLHVMTTWPTNPTLADSVLDSLARRMPAPRLPGLKPNRYRTERQAIDAAVLALGPQARPEFEFNVIRLDGMWIWKPTEEMRAVARGSFQAKINGGARRARMIGARTVKTAKVVLELPEGQALALAQLCQRLKIEDIIRLSNGKSDMDTAVAKLGSALKEAGFNPQ